MEIQENIENEEIKKNKYYESQKRACQRYRENNREKFNEICLKSYHKRMNDPILGEKIREKRRIDYLEKYKGKYESRNYHLPHSELKEIDPDKYQKVLEQKRVNSKRYRDKNKEGFNKLCLKNYHKLMSDPEKSVKVKEQQRIRNLRYREKKRLEKELLENLENENNQEKI